MAPIHRTAEFNLLHKLANAAPEPVYVGKLNYLALKAALADGYVVEDGIDHYKITSAGFERFEQLGDD